MKKIVFILILAMFLSCKAWAVDINYSIYADTTPTGSTSHAPGGVEYGAPAETKDGNSVGGGYVATGLGATTIATITTANVTVSVEHTFALPHNITTLQHYFYLRINPVYATDGGTYAMYVYQGGWSLVDSGGLGLASQEVEGWITKTGTWANVTAVKVDIQLTANKYAAITNTEIREIEAWGPPATAGYAMIY
jgi:hypothetical protein